MTLHVAQTPRQGVVEPRSLPRAEGPEMVRAVILDCDEDVQRLLDQGEGLGGWLPEFKTLMATRHMGCESYSFDHKFYRLSRLFSFRDVWVCHLVAGRYECFGVATSKKGSTSNACFNLMTYWNQDLEEEPLAFVGAGKPETSFRWSTVVNKGTGGKSKQNKDPEANPSGVEGALKVVEKDKAKDPEVRKPCDSTADVLRELFVCSAPPEIKKRFRQPDHANFAVDVEGHPFCGLVCVDIGAGVTPCVGKYIGLTPKHLLSTPEEAVGKPDYLGMYAKSVGVNLRILHPAQRLFGRTQTDYYGGFAEWVVIKFVPNADHEVGHYVLMCQQTASESGFAITNLPDGSQAPIRLIHWWKCFATMLLFFAMRVACLRYSHVDWAVLMYWGSVIPALLLLIQLITTTSLSWEESAVPGQRVSLANNSDMRTIPNRREKIVHQDSFLRVSVGSRLVCNPWFGALFPFTWVVNKLITRFKIGTTNLVVSEPLYMTISVEMEVLALQGLDPLSCLSSLSRFRELNTPAASGVLTDTAMLLRLFAAGLKRGHKEVPDIGWKPLAAPGLTSYVPNLDTIANNQEIMVLKGRGMHFMDKPNHVIKYSLAESKTDAEIGVYPIGCLHTDKGRVGPGLFSVTNSVNTLAAFCGRAMSKDLTSRAMANIYEYIEFALTFLDHFIDQVEDPGEEPIVEDVFREHYKGKRPETWIAKNLSDYERYRTGRMTAKEEKKFRQNGFFVKFEHNTKNGQARPRGIMTMSCLMLMLCCPVLVLIHLWNLSPFSKFQVKSMTPQETFDKIMGHTDEPYSVSDYSAFESSIDQYLRLVESYVIVRLCDRFGWTQLKANYLKFTLRGRKLTTRWGEFYIGTRCSGDFWTSFGNGIVNVTVMAFCAYKKGRDLVKMLAEGDDGLVPSDIPDVDIINGLGLGFSSELKGTQDGDCDFLRKRVVAGKAYLPIGKALGSSLFVKKGHRLKRSKQLAILRNMAHSLYHQSPGHPILSALVNRIWKETSGISDFKGMDSYLQSYWSQTFVDPRLKRVEVDESMREEVAKGAAGFAAFSIPDQLELEKRLEFWPMMYIGRLLDEDEDFIKLIKSTPCKVGGLSTNCMDFLIDEADVCLCTDTVRAKLREEVKRFVESS